MTNPADYLLVRAGERRVGLPISQVVEVIEPGRTYPVPTIESAVRGVVAIRGRVVPIVHLGALLDGRVPAIPGGTGVIVALAGGLICLEVEAAESVVREAGLPVPPSMTLPWAVAVAHYPDGLVPLLDLGSLAGMLAGTAADPATVSNPAATSGTAAGNRGSTPTTYLPEVRPA